MLRQEGDSTIDWAPEPGYVVPPEMEILRMSVVNVANASGFCSCLNKS